MARLDRDLLFEIARDLFHIQKICKDKMSETPNIANFMLVNRECKHAFLSQFSQAKSFCFNSWDKSELSDTGSGKKLVYRGEYDKDKWLMAFLIQHGKFNPEELVFTYVLDAEAKNDRDDDLSGKSAMECLSMLCKLKDGGLSLTNYRGSELLLKSFEAEASVSLLGDLDKILGLNSTKTKLDISIENFRCLPEAVKFSAIQSLRTESLELIFNTNWDEVSNEEFYASDWMELLSYAVTSCPNLKNLDVRVGLHESSPDDSQLVCNRVHKAMKALIDMVLPQIAFKKCFIRIEFNAYVYALDLQEIQDSGHELFRIGVCKPGVNDSDVCRVVPIGNSAELSFCISEFDDGLSADREALQEFYDSVEYWSAGYSEEYGYDSEEGFEHSDFEVI